MVQMLIMTAQMDTASPPGAPALPNACIESNRMDEAVYHDEYVQMALFSLMKNLCADTDECQLSDTPSPSTPVDVRDAFQYKLEQAADLVKTHLLYAVREEVDALRGKLSDLEMKIYRLEMENRLLLREYVPPEILERMRSDTTDRFTKRKRSVVCAPPSQQQSHLEQEQCNFSDCIDNLSAPVLTARSASPGGRF